MMEAMSSRAPDGFRSWERPGLALADAASSGPDAVCGDIRLDNRTELAHRLGLRADATDGEVVLAAYERYGESCPEHLLGDFAFVISDVRRRALFCVCDRFAVKPLFWHRSAKLAAVATEIKALLTLEAVPRRLNEDRFADFLTIQFEDPASTVYRDIERLPAAHSVTLSSEGARLRRYWSLDPNRAWTGGSDGKYEEAFRATFTEAVRTRIPDRGPVAALLSGGLDSSSVVAVALDQLRASGRLPLHTLSAVFDTFAAADERPYIDAVHRLGGMVPHFVRPEQLGPLDDWEGAAWRGAEPEPHQQVAIAHALYSAAAESGLRCLLDGLGGDFVVSFGAERLMELALTGRWLSLRREAKALGQADFVSPAALRGYLLSPLVPEWVTVLRLRRGERKMGMPAWSRNMPLNPQFAREAGLRARYERSEAGSRHPPRNARAAHAQQVTSAHVALGLGVVDRLSGIFGVEPRYPFLDSRLAELCLAIPAEQKLRAGYNRDIQRRALAQHLPPEIRWRTGKGAPGVHTAHTLPTRGRTVMDEVILGGGTEIGRYVDIQALRAQYRSCLDGADASAWFPVYRAVVGALWLADAQARHGLTL
jgi:asparagine synthase (glutamine-hydrolysing)